MKNYTQMIRQAMIGVVACGALALAGGASYTAHAQEVNAPFRGVSRDPFVKYRPAFKRKVERKVAIVVAPPTPHERINMYKAQKADAMNRQLPAPKATTALLLSELQVTGIFRTPRGYAAMVEATPIKLSYTIYPGESFYDGQLVAIEESRLVFRKQTRWTDGRREVSVETKPLRQPTVEDALTQTKPASGSQSPAEESQRDNGVSKLREAGATPGAPEKKDAKGYWADRDKVHKMLMDAGCKNGVVKEGEVICNQ